MKPYYEESNIKIFCGDCLDILKQLDNEFVNCCVTSPPYWALRSYLPNEVKIKNGLSKEDKDKIERELTSLGIKGIIR